MNRLGHAGIGLLGLSTKFALSFTRAVQLRLRKQRKSLFLKLVVQKFKEGLFVVFPFEAIFGVADLEAFQMNLAYKALLAIGVAGSKNKFWPVWLIQAALDQPFAPEQGESGC